MGEWADERMSGKMIARWWRRLFLWGMALLPGAMWVALHALGVSLRAVKVPVDVPLGAVLIPWWVGWETAALAAWLEWRYEPHPPAVSWRREIGLGLLYASMGAFVGAFFALWVWLLAVTWNVAHALTPAWLQPALDCGLTWAVLGLGWMAVLLWLVTLLARAGVADAFRRGIRRLLLGDESVTPAQVLALLDAVPLPPEVRTDYVRRIRAFGLTHATVERLLADLQAHAGADTAGATTQALLQLEQALRNWLVEHGA